ncbi:MAG TPA: SMI1/KNR4 family protein [Tepidisphaeraceae bacterium]|nr:SMI1/KNR4 family protein [Tepidisphaeraceae bacterium]
MNSRISCFRMFEARFRKPAGFPSPEPPTPIELRDIRAIEEVLKCRLPESCCEFITAIGPCEVRGLGDSWSFHGTERIPMPFESLWAPWQIPKQCESDWLAPIPSTVSGGRAVASDVAWKYLLPFASDGCGNWHCFRRQSFSSDDSPVYFFDHDGGEIAQIAPSLESLIRSYLRLPGAE